MKSEENNIIRNHYNLSLMVFALSIVLLFGAFQTSSKIFVGISLIAMVLSGIWMARHKLNYYRHIQVSATILRGLHNESQKEIGKNTRKSNQAL